jgi:hypothetical protein
MLDDLNRNNAWPPLKPVKDDEGDTKTLFKLLWHMRNAISHGLVEFSGVGPQGDSRDVKDILIEFNDRNSSESPVDWEFRIKGKDLESFCRRIMQIVWD